MSESQFSSVGVASWDVEKWVRKNSRLLGSNFLVSLTVAFFHSRQRGYAFPTIETLASAARVSEKTAKRAIREMKDSGEWIVVSGRGGPDAPGFVSARANRYYPTALLAGIELSNGAEEDLPFVQRQEFLAAIRRAGVLEANIQSLMLSIYDVLSDDYKNDLTRQVLTGEYKSQLEKIVERIKDISAQGEDVATFVNGRLSHTRTAPTIIISWLATWGLRAPSTLR